MCYKSHLFLPTTGIDKSQALHPIRFLSGDLLYFFFIISYLFNIFLDFFFLFPMAAEKYLKLIFN